MQKTSTRQDLKAVQREAALLRETQGLFLALAGALDGLLVPAQALWRRLAQTGAYKRVEGLDDGAGEPVWNLAGTIQVMLTQDIDKIIGYLRKDARRAGNAAARRAQRRTDE